MSDYRGHSWDQQETFQDIMAEQIKQAPWLLISIVAHALVIFLLWNVEWQNTGLSKEGKTAMEEVLPDEKPPEEEEPEPEPPEPEEVIETPVIKDAEEITENVEEVLDDVPTDHQTDSPFDKDAFNDIIGIGGGAGGHGKFGGRFGRKKGRGGGQLTERAVADALEWLAKHQDEEGKWDTDGFDSHCPADDKCTGHGSPVHDVGLTGLALLAFLGDGNTLREGRYKDKVKDGCRWLMDQQDDEGLIGEKAGQSFMYSHIIASIALCEAFGLSSYTIMRPNVQKAINFISTSRNPYKVWRYYPRDGDNDSSVTGWAVIALASAKSFKDKGLKVSDEDFKFATAWYDEMTDPNTGRIGYTTKGSQPARPTELMDKFPASKSECITAVGLLARFFAEQDPKQVPVMYQHADLLAKKPPLWAEDGSIDMYYWYYGSFAMYQMGGNYWKDWNTKMQKAVVDSQIKGTKHNKGSWDPVGVWGHEGGRVYSTAIMALCLEVYYRYSQLIGAR